MEAAGTSPDTYSAVDRAAVRSGSRGTDLMSLVMKSCRFFGGLPVAGKLNGNRVI